LTQDDLKKLKESSSFFARKFNVKADPVILDIIDHEIGFRNEVSAFK